MSRTFYDPLIPLIKDSSPTTKKEREYIFLILVVKTEWTDCL